MADMELRGQDCSLLWIRVNSRVVHGAVQGPYDCGVLGDGFALDNNFPDGEPPDNVHNGPPPALHQANPLFSTLHAPSEIERKSKEIDARAKNLRLRHNVGIIRGDTCSYCHSGLL